MDLALLRDVISNGFPTDGETILGSGTEGATGGVPFHVKAETGV